MDVRTLFSLFFSLSVENKNRRYVHGLVQVMVNEGLLADAVLLYPDDGRICRHVADLHRWNEHKKHFVEDIVIDKANRATLRNFRYEQPPSPAAFSTRQS